MSRKDKLLNKLYSKPVPNDMTFREIEIIMERYGCEIKPGGNHMRVVYKKLGAVIPIPKHGKCVGEAYVVQLKKLLDAIEEKECR